MDAIEDFSTNWFKKLFFETGGTDAAGTCSQRWLRYVAHASSAPGEKICSAPSGTP